VPLGLQMAVFATTASDREGARECNRPRKRCWPLGAPKLPPPKLQKQELTAEAVLASKWVPKFA